MTGRASKRWRNPAEPFALSQPALLTQMHTLPFAQIHTLPFAQIHPLPFAQIHLFPFAQIHPFPFALSLSKGTPATPFSLSPLLRSG